MVSPWNTYDRSYHSWDGIACQITARASGNISQLDAVIADLPTRRRQFRLITPGEGCVHTLPTEDQACNMIADYAALHEPKKVFFNLQLRGFFAPRKHHHSTHYRAQVGGRSTANKSLLNSACDASRSARSACCLGFIAGGTYREEWGGHGQTKL